MFETVFPMPLHGLPTHGRFRWFIHRSELATFVISFAILGLVLLPICIADRYHLEDWRRLLDGTFGWIGEGRPLTELLMRALNLGDPFKDLSPLPQIATIAVLSYSAVLISRKFAIRPPLLAALIAFPIGGSPFFLENLSFRYDSLGMALAMTLALVPLLTTESLSFKAWFTGALCIFASLNFYQTGINAFFVFCVVELSLLQLRNDSLQKLQKIILLRVAQFLAGFVPYLLLARALIRGSYNQQHFTLVTNVSELGAIARNWKTSWHFIYGSLPAGQREIFRLPVLLAALLLIGIGLYYVRTMIRSRQSVLVVALALVAVILLPLAWIGGALGPVLFPANAIILLPRIHMGLGPLLASSFVLICATFSRLGLDTKWLCVPFAIPAYAMIMFAFVFGNTLKEQKRYEERITSKLLDDVKLISSTYPVEAIIINGNVGYAPAVRQVMRKYRLLRSLVSIDLRTDLNDGSYIHNMLRYYGLDTPPEDSDEIRSAVVSESAKFAPLQTREHYRLCAIDRHLVIDFYSGPAP
ncbi:MAG: glucosyltransferase domain-containing protein [Verrucomicrobia bacterium]|nr:glucosyltransferase domain-containing protein [Verrucomicrobiota bacterium]